MDYEEVISSCRWMVQVPYPAYRVCSRVSPIHTLYHLFFLCTWGRLRRTPYTIILGVRTDDFIHRGVHSLLETLITRTSWGKYHHLPRTTNDLTSPVGRELIIYASHRSSITMLLYYSLWLVLVTCIAIVGIFVFYCFFPFPRVSNIYSIFIFYCCLSSSRLSEFDSFPLSLIVIILSPVLSF